MPAQTVTATPRQKLIEQLAFKGNYINIMQTRPKTGNIFLKQITYKNFLTNQLKPSYK